MELEVSVREVSGRRLGGAKGDMEMDFEEVEMKFLTDPLSLDS